MDRGTTRVRLIASPVWAGCLTCEFGTSVMPDAVGQASGMSRLAQMSVSRLITTMRS